MPSPKTPGSSSIDKFQSSDVDMAFAGITAARHSQNPHDPLHVRCQFRGFHGSLICYGLPVCSPSCTDPTGFPAAEDFYIQASNRLVTLPAAGYDYSIDWTPMLAGLSPAGMAARLAAHDPVTLRSP
jgi:hypothetical protein